VAAGQTVVIVGGGLIGLALALHLVSVLKINVMAFGRDAFPLSGSTLIAMV
jgi:glycine/D-amino acid oxidase-like deaminating enzyme